MINYRFLCLRILFYLLLPNNIIINGEKEYEMPDEGELHNATWMAYGATVAAWGTKSFYGPSRLIARQDLIRIAANLARFERVNMIINKDDVDEAKKYLNEIKNEKENVNSGGKILPNIEAAGSIEFIIHPVNDLWTRDTGATFVFDKKKKPYAINFNFNGWGQKNTGVAGWKKSLEKIINNIPKQRILEDSKIADFIVEKTGIQEVNTWLVMEGGGIEVNGEGTAICTESCILNENRNPGKTKEDVEKELLRLLGVKKVIWLPGLKGKEITDGHVDFYARFVDDSKIVISLDNDEFSSDYNTTHENLKILSKATDAQGNKLTIIPLVVPNYIKVKESFNARNGLNNDKSFFNNESFAAGYVGFYLANNCVLMAKFGDNEADKLAFDTLSGIFPNRTIMQITTDGIANGGGTIHCATQQQIYLKN